MTHRYQLSPIVQKKLKELNLNADDVIRKALEIKAEGFDAGEGAYFIEGTAFLAWYKDRPHWGTVKNGAINIEGKEYNSVSGAAAAVTGRPTTNGWSFWLVKVPGKNEFTPIATFRK
jgi:hypothetical protein